MRHHCFAGLIIVVLTSLAVLGRSDLKDQNTERTAPTNPTCPATPRFLKIESSQARETRFVGAEALSYIRSKAVADPRFRSAQARSAAAARARGWKPTSIAVVVLAEGLVVSERPSLVTAGSMGQAVRDFFMPTLRAQTFVEADVETIFESWDDADDDTWEGHVYARHLNTNEFVSGNHQKNTVVENYILHWADVNDSEPTQGSPYDCRRTGSDCGWCNDPYAPDCNLRHAMTNWWYSCSAAAVSCLYPQGPRWVSCIGVRCAGVFGLGWLYQSKEHFQKCYSSVAHMQFCEGD